MADRISWRGPAPMMAAADTGADPPVDLRPLLASDRDAVEMLLLARGQLNRAFRGRGLRAPDALRMGGWHDADPADLDDPAAGGLARARARYGAAFADWTSEMPAWLVDPVLEILRRTHAALRERPDGGAAATAVRTAHDFLADHPRRRHGQRYDA